MNPRLIKLPQDKPHVQERKVPIGKSRDEVVNDVRLIESELAAFIERIGGGTLTNGSIQLGLRDIRMKLKAATDVDI